MVTAFSILADSQALRRVYEAFAKTGDGQIRNVNSHFRILAVTFLAALTARLSDRGTTLGFPGPIIQTPFLARPPGGCCSVGTSTTSRFRDDYFFTITIMTKNPYAKHTSNPHLEPLLEKLRPFQREAYDFCVTGKASSRQYADSSASAPEGEYDPQYLGKGRILLADEMG